MFASDVLLKPRQQKLVSFFHEYKLSEPKEQETKKDSKKKLGVKPETPANIEDLFEGE